MEMILEILSIFLSAALLENMVFGRALGVSRTTLVQEKRADVVAFSLSVLFMCTVSSVLGYGIRWLLGGPRSRSPFLQSRPSCSWLLSSAIACCTCW